MTKRYKIRGLWVPNEGHDFFGETFPKFVAELPDIQDSTRNTTVTLYLPKEYAGKGNPVEDDPRLVELELEPGTYIMQLVPYTIIVGDPSKATRSPVIFADDVMVERSPIKMLAIPAS